MTPSREKWWSQLSDKEKYLRISIKACGADIKMSKYNFNNYKIAEEPEDFKPAVEFVMEFRKKRFKQDIRQRKYILTALKHELERGGKCGLVYRNVSNILMPTCDVCGAVVSGGIIKPTKYCPHCGRKIKEQE